MRTATSGSGGCGCTRTSRRRPSGRRPRSGERAGLVIAVRVTAAEATDLAAVARETHQTISELIREAVNEFVADYRERGVF